MTQSHWGGDTESPKPSYNHQLNHQRNISSSNAWNKLNDELFGIGVADAAAADIIQEFYSKGFTDTQAANTVSKMWLAIAKQENVANPVGLLIAKIKRGEFPKNGRNGHHNGGKKYYD